MDRACSKARRLLADSGAPAMVARFRDRLGRMNSELAGAALSRTGKGCHAAPG